MDNIIAVGIGMGLRALLESIAPESYPASAIVGLWEGVVLNHFLAKYPSAIDPYVAFAFRLFIDYLFTKSVTRLGIVLMWTLLGILLSQVVIDMSDDRRFRRLWRKAYRSPPLSWFTPSPPSRSSRVRFYSSPTSSRTARYPAPSSVDTPIPAPAVRPTTQPIPGRFDQYSELSVPIETEKSDSVTHSEASGETERRSPSPLRPRTPSELEYIEPLPVIPDVHSQIDFDPRRHTLPPQSSPPFPTDFPDAPSIHSGLTTPVNDPLSLSRPWDAEDRPLVHSGLTTPENMPVPMQVHTEGLPPIEVYNAEDYPLADFPDQTPVPIRIRSADPSPSAPVAMPEPQLPPASEIPDIPTPDDGPPPPGKDLPRTPPPTFAEATALDEADLDAEDSVITATGGKDAIISKADELRKQARAKELERDRLRAASKQAEREGRWFDRFRMLHDLETAHQSASKLHAKAARRYVRAHNLHPLPQEIDVHRLQASEAIVEVERALREALDTGASSLRIITGKGNHSKGKIPVLKPDIIRKMEAYHIVAEPDPKNAGVLIIHIPQK